MTTLSLVVIVVVSCVCIYTASYGVWAWRKEFRIGAVAVFILTLLVFTVPIYAVFFVE